MSIKLSPSTREHQKLSKELDEQPETGDAACEDDAPNLQTLLFDRSKQRSEIVAMDRREHLRGENATGNPRAVDYREHQRAGETRGKQEAMKINRLCIHSVLPNRMDRRIKLQLSASEQKKYWTVRSSCSLCNSIRHRRFRRCTEFHTEFCPKEDLQHPSDDKYTARSN